MQTEWHWTLRSCLMHRCVDIVVCTHRHKLKSIFWSVFWGSPTFGMELQLGKSVPVSGNPWLLTSLCYSQVIEQPWFYWKKSYFGN